MIFSYLPTYFFFFVLFGRVTGNRDRYTFLPYKSLNRYTWKEKNNSKDFTNINNFFQIHHSSISGDHELFFDERQWINTERNRSP